MEKLENLIAMDSLNDKKTEMVLEDPTQPHDVGNVKKEPGVASIKAEYVIPKIKKIVIVPTPSTSQEINENGAEDKDTPVENPRKRKRGQNKKRPRTVPIQLRCERLCPSISKDNAVCQFGEKCHFNHDIKSYVLSKLPDIGEECINFSLYGKCIYGLECRFGKSHISEDFKNIIDTEKYANVLEGPLRTKNVMSKDLQFKLRKKTIQYTKADNYLKSNKSLTENNEIVHTSGTILDEDTIRIKPEERKKIDFSDKLYLAPLTTVGNLPFRRICKRQGADVTCSEMAMTTDILQGHQSEWALLKRHHTEDVFGVQLCGSNVDTMMKCTELLNMEAEMDFIDVNIGCPIDLVFKRGGGCALMGRLTKFQQIIDGMVSISDVPITVKMRTGIYDNNWTAHKVIPKIREWGASLVTLHGRSREQRYTRVADWDYIQQCALVAKPMPLFGNGDILSFEDANTRRDCTGVSGLMVARGALIKPWIFTEIKEQRHWDISSTERLEILKEYTNYGLEHWGSDTKGVENTRRFLLEWLSFLYRYIPIGLLEVLPPKINERPPPYRGRNDLETLMASNNCADWVKISEMLLGPVPSNFTFLPKHRANSYS